ncbi:MAG: hypothetical protein RL616_1655 [Verrucomicrobiota bacterium]
MLFPTTPAKLDPPWRYPAGHWYQTESFFTASRGQHILGGDSGDGRAARLLQPAFNWRHRLAALAAGGQPVRELIHLRFGQFFDGGFNFQDAAHGVKSSTARRLRARCPCYYFYLRRVSAPVVVWLGKPTGLPGGRERRRGSDALPWPCSRHKNFARHCWRDYLTCDF